MIQLELARRDTMIEALSQSLDPYVSEHPEYWMRWMAYCLYGGPAYIGRYEGRLVGAGGLRFVRKGLANSWLIICYKPFMYPSLPTVETLDYLADTIWSLKTMIEILCKRFDIERLRAAVRKETKASERLLRQMGYELIKKETKEHLYFNRILAC